ncbi:uncharacterized protein BDR25DRAFT_194562, partial [Lindgomyces ingoldianus]
QKMMNSKRMRKYMEKREAKLREGADLRRREEQDTTKGEKVWFSRYVANGRLRHWVLLTHGTKYELRRSRNVEENPAGSQGKPTGEFTFFSKPFTIDQEQREALQSEMKMPEQDGYFVCLIGWTRMSKDQVDSACEEAFKSFGKYNLLWNNCQ